MYSTHHIHDSPLQMTPSSLPYLDLDALNLKHSIGHGTVLVYKAILEGKPIAVKKMDCDKNQVPHEVEVHSKLHPHPNVLPLL